MRSLVDELRPRAVAEVGLVRSLQKHLAMRKRRDGLEVRLAVSGEERGQPAVQEALFRMAQEALNNVLRHAGVKEAAVELAFGDKEVSLAVRDAGRGFTAGTASGGESFGLINMRERVEALGGTFRLDSAPGAGTTVQARVPLAQGGRE
jgi:two-component system sensor histidine kinase DegS